jgi:methyl-accepting chemotaxis protein
MDDQNSKKSRKLLFKTIGTSTVILVFALGLLGYLSLYSKQRLAFQTAEFMGQNKLKGDMFFFENRIAQEYGQLTLKDDDLLDKDGRSIKSQFKMLDNLSSNLGVVATIFVRENGDFRRIATSIKDVAGNRAVNTFLGTNSKAYVPITSGNMFFGNIAIFGNDYIVLYKPLFDKETKNIIGILFLGVDMLHIEEYIHENSSAQTFASIAIGAFLLLAVIIANAISINIIILKPISRVTDILRDISEGEGDLTQELPMKSNDEVGMLASFFNKLMNTLKIPVGETKSAVGSLASAAEELSSVSSKLSASSEESSLKANDVASAADQMSVNMNTIASAIEEMSASISQIANNASETRLIANSASEKSTNATKAMNELRAAAKEIGQVTDVIKKIADKTNLLALNAAIEAASAGDSGKGFAVVASEVKELAGQSAIGADDITKRVESIQNSTNSAVEVIRDVSSIIEKINNSIVAIAGHVDQQTKASNEIASNVAQANAGAKKVAGSIGEIAMGCEESSKDSSQVHSAASNLEKIASKLHVVMGKFKV